MLNKCINIITVRGRYEMVDAFYNMLSDLFGDDLLFNDGMGNAEKHLITLTLDSYMQIPKQELLSITRSLSDTTGLIVRVYGEKIWSDHIEQALFKDGAWDFETTENVEENMRAVNEKGINEIRQYLKDNGAIIPKNDIYKAVYFLNNGESGKSVYSKIDLTPNNKITVRLANSKILSEDKLNNGHILNIHRFIDIQQRNNQNKK